MNGVACIVYSGPYDGFRFTIASPYTTLFLRRYTEGAVAEWTIAVFFKNEQGAIPHKLYQINDAGLHEYRPYHKPIPSEVTPPYETTPQ